MYHLLNLWKNHEKVTRTTQHWPHIKAGRIQKLGSDAATIKLKTCKYSVWMYIYINFSMLNLLWLLDWVKQYSQHDKSHRFLKEKNVAQNAREAVAGELDFVEDGRNFVCYFRCFYWLFNLPISPQCSFSIPCKCYIYSMTATIAILLSLVKKHLNEHFSFQNFSFLIEKSF